MSSLLTPRNILIAVALVFGVGTYYFINGDAIDSPEKVSLGNPVASPAKAAPSATVDLADFMKAGDLKDNIQGNPDAKVTMVEYSSMTCPHCATFHKDVLPAIKKNYIDTNKVRYILREFPLDNLAAAAFMLARCAPKEKYFDFVDMLYAQQKVWAFGQGHPLPPLLKLARQVGFSEESFNKCLKNQKLLDGINWIRDRGSKKFGVKSTPSFFINGERFKGTMDSESFAKKFDALLK